MKLESCDGTTSCPHCAEPSRPVEAGPTILQTKVPETLRAIANRLPATVQLERFNLLGIAQWIEDGRYEEWFREGSAVPAPPADTPATPKCEVCEGQFAVTFVPDTRTGKE